MTTAFVFPGQGSQSTGMLAELAEQHTVVGETFAAASEVLGYDLWQLIQNGPAEALNQTRHTQPAMLTAGISVWRVWQNQGGRQPNVLAGHSLGEYSALVAAESLSFEDAVALVAKRGQLMQEAVPTGSGAMAAILGLEDEQVHQICRDQAEGQVINAVNFNAPGQVVVAGHREAVERTVSGARAAGAKRALVLPVSVPSHCDLMRPAAEKLAHHLASVEISPPRIPVLNNVDVADVTAPQALRDALVHQLYSPVRWVEIVQRMAADGVDTLVECGPGKVLIGLNKRIQRDMTALAIYDNDTLTTALAALS